MRIQILFNDTKCLVATTLARLASECGDDYTEFEVLQVLKEMCRDNQIKLMTKNRKMNVI
ncbi:MAG: hypothetical protein H6Q67_1300 [Firmicutes bacterium]|nr:hypothetical protein [Bacillota bacterium]